MMPVEFHSIVKRENSLFIIRRFYQDGQYCQNVQEKKIENQSFIKFDRFVIIIILIIFILLFL
jgi:hypothetical protein